MIRNARVKVFKLDSKEFSVSLFHTCGAWKKWTELQHVQFRQYMSIILMYVLSVLLCLFYHRRATETQHTAVGATDSWFYFRCCQLNSMSWGQSLMVLKPTENSSFHSTSLSAFPLASSLGSTVALPVRAMRKAKSKQHSGKVCVI